ncbi:MAG: hypothetical protein JNJ61_27810 [Anaerolineae bacterium]|nr:hypothetical protein [Anaerolineae bacterium]
MPRRIAALVLLMCIGYVGGDYAAAQETTPPPDIIAACSALLPDDRPMPSGPDAPSVRIVQPASGVVYGTAVTIVIEAANFDVTSEGRHWHLWVNGTLHGMVYQPMAIIDLEPGTYQICASLGNNDHADLGVPAGILLTVERPAAGTPTPTLPVSREQAAVLPEPGLGPVEIILVVALALLAAVGGWWLGARLPKRGKP